MEKYLASALLTLSFSLSAQTIKGTIPVICADEKTFADTVIDFGEEPILTALSSRDMGDGIMVPTALVIFLNTKSGTYTIAEKVDTMYCVIALGENMKPFFDNDPKQDFKGT